MSYVKRDINSPQDVSVLALYLDHMTNFVFPNVKTS